KSLGAWFPTASVQKVAPLRPDDRVTIALFYQYIHPLWTEQKKLDAIQYVEQLGPRLGIGGRCRVGREGINATISGTDENVRSFTRELGVFDAHFQTTDFKYIENLPLDRAFKDLKVLPVKEIVFYGIAPEADLGEGGIHLPPEQYHQKLGEPDTVVIDIRNKYEADIGNFGGQQMNGGAKLIVPEVRKSTDFPEWMKTSETRAQLEGKNVLMYCTGGVRCERASAFLKKEYGDSVKGVYQLQGGVEKYLQAFPDGGYWEGKNYVFDKREAIGVGYEEGVGGVASSSKSKKKRKLTAASDVSAGVAAPKAKILGKCCACNAAWDRYIGKKKCYMCGVPVLLCDGCLTKKVDKTPGMELKMRCPICVKENITVPASEVEFTNNGIAAKKDRAPAGAEPAKAAASVCKWGGGHAKSKKMNRQRERQDTVNKTKLQDQPCKFGRACTRTDCWFSHEV
ncbi:unnamed protein product, partial [Ectocarpus fasciculatus]